MTPNNTLINTIDNRTTDYPESYFETLYANNNDPWHYQTRWYERRKRDICLAVLPKASYSNAIELGCGNGILSALLAPRCQTLTSIDANRNAVQLAKQRLDTMSHVQVIQAIIPADLSTLGKTQEQMATANPRTSYDLIVISEILYYLLPADIELVIGWIRQNIAPDGTLLCCHWRYAIDGFELTGETVHQRLHKAFSLSQQANNLNMNFIHQSKLIDSDFLLDVWQHSSKTVAMTEGLI